jgi:hypothetical protein
MPINCAKTTGKMGSGINWQIPPAEPRVQRQAPRHKAASYHPLRILPRLAGGVLQKILPLWRYLLEFAACGS